MAIRGSEKERKEQAARNWENGADGESWACAYLQRKGYHVVLRNWRNPRDQREEIDLICLDEGVLVFIEVKTRRGGALTPGYHAVTVRKKRALKRAIQAFLWTLPPERQPHTTRIDVIEVENRFGGPPEIRHYDNISLRTPRPWR